MNVGWKFEGLLFRITLRSLGRGKDIKLHFEKKIFFENKNCHAETGFVTGKVEKMTNTSK